MKNNLLISFCFCLLAIYTTAQESKKGYEQNKGYVSFEGEMIFSFASFETPAGTNLEQNMRWSPVFNLAWHYNYDVADFFGLNLGFGIRNVGFIVKGDELDPEDIDIDRKKYRTYNFGLPVGFKLGRLDQEKPLFAFAGYEVELPFHFKEKQFDGGDKLRKRTDWFSDRANIFQQAVFVGVQLPQGFSLKAKYYLTEFFNADFEETITIGDNPEELIIRPYENFNANVFYFSITWFPFQDLEYTLHQVRYD